MVHLADEALPQDTNDAIPGGAVEKPPVAVRQRSSGATRHGDLVTDPHRKQPRRQVAGIDFA